MEAITVAAGPTTTPPKHMLALAKAQRRVREIADIKRELRFGTITFADALTDPRATGAVTVGQLLVAQRGWGEASAIEFLKSVGASEAVMVKRAESLTPRQRDVLARAFREPMNPLGPRDWW